jgi:hypothetical protein
MLAIVIVIVPAHTPGRASDPRPSLFAELPVWFGPAVVLVAVGVMVWVTRRIGRDG